MPPTRQQLQNRLAMILEQLQSDAKSVCRQVMNPGFIQTFPEATRVGQIIAFMFVGVVVMISLQLIVVLNELVAQILVDGGSLGTTQDAIFSWLSTAITAGFYIIAAWGWFQFVRTAGFGLFTWDPL